MRCAQSPSCTWLALAIGLPLAFESRPSAAPGPPSTAPADLPFDDVHLHLTSCVRKGTDVRRILELMGTGVRRVAVFGIPSQQKSSFHVSGAFAPTHDVDTDARPYPRSSVDAAIATSILSLPGAQRARFDPMITGFNRADGHAVDHVRRVLETFPGVFSGIGELTTSDPAVDRLLDFAGEVGLVVLLHDDADGSFEVEALLRRHPNTTIVWAHARREGVVHPVASHVPMVRAILDDPALAHVHFDLSWSDTAKSVVADPDGAEVVADVINARPERFLFGTDESAPTDRDAYVRVLRRYAPLWARLTPRASDLVRRLNYERLFDEARRRVRAWERTHGGRP